MEALDEASGDSFKFEASGRVENWLPQSRSKHANMFEESGAAKVNWPNTYRKHQWAPHCG